MTETLERNKRTVTQFYDLMFNKFWAGSPTPETPQLALLVGVARWLHQLFGKEDD